MTINYDRLCRGLVEESRDAIIFADRDGIIRLWNRGAAEIFGFPEAEALGRPLDIIIPENLRLRHREGYQRALAAGSSKYARDLLAVPALHRDGSRISVEFTIVLLRGDDGEVQGAGAVIREVTAHRQRDQALKERLKALEAELVKIRQASGPEK